MSEMGWDRILFSISRPSPKDMQTHSSVTGNSGHACEEEYRLSVAAQLLYHARILPVGSRTRSQTTRENDLHGTLRCQGWGLPCDSLGAMKALRFRLVYCGRGLVNRGYLGIYTHNSNVGTKLGNGCIEWKSLMVVFTN